MIKLLNIRFHKIRLGWLSIVTLIATVAFLSTVTTTSAQPGANCSLSFSIDKTLSNGARWQLCWEHRSFDGIVYRDIYFTPPGGTSRQVLSQGSISQVHVPYDDNSARFHDITDDGFGDKNLSDLTAAECPSGTLLLYGTKHAICQQIIPRGYAFKGVGTQGQGEMLSLFSVSMSGDYNYTPVWRFYDDGTLDLQMGATGKLQRFTTDSRFGWPVRNNGTLGTSHIHNYYWRLDFDLGETANDDVVEELNYVANADNSSRTLGVSRLSSEAGRSIDRTGLRSWRIRDGATTNASGDAISYQLEPIDIANRDVGPAFEPWTTNDFYVTKANDCERYVSHNPTLGGCAGNLAAFINGESLTGADVVLWYGTTFHHIPRDEDELYMHAHWNGFRLTPVNWMDSNPSAKNVTTCAVGDVTCNGKNDAADALFMLQYDVELRTISNQLPLPKNTLYGYSCDISGEGACNATDALFSLQCSVGLPNLFCTANGRVISAGQTPELSTVLLQLSDETAPGQKAVWVDSPTSLGAISLVLALAGNEQPPTICTADPEQHFDLATCNVDATVDAANATVRLSLISISGVVGKQKLGTLHFGATNDAAITLQSVTAADVAGRPMPSQIITTGTDTKLFLPVVVR